MSQVLERGAPPSSPAKQPAVPLATILSGVALAISCGVACWTFSHDPLGRGLAAYDLSSPKAALVSQLKMLESQDYRAILESADQFNAKRAQDKLRTLEFRKESEFRGKKILFISYEENGIRKHDIQSFEKDAETGAWKSAYASITSVFEGSDETPDEKKLRGMIKKWRDSGALE
ncbi:MAG TPA: hypothetical protein VFB80_22470 [Pirellulaceae bacterium]|nr:hypothetical protein [Pirellulaceae bacterium]